MKMEISATAIQILRDIKKVCEAHDATCQDSDGDTCIFWDAAKGCILRNTPEEWRI